jgi:hypothetical protein
MRRSARSVSAPFHLSFLFRSSLVLFFASLLIAPRSMAQRLRRPSATRQQTAAANSDQPGAATAQAMSYNQARKIVIENFRDLSAQVRRDSIKFTADGRGDYLPTGEYTLHPRILEHVTIQRFFHSHGKQPYYYYHLMFDGRDPIRARDAGGRALHDCNTIGCSSIYDTSYPYAVLYLANLRLADDAPRAQAFADGLNTLAGYARESDSERDAEWREFQQKAAAWRALLTKPPISDQVDQHWLLDEDAFKEKKLDVALNEYAAGLEVNPLWPTGHFNAAMMYAEEKAYADAIWHMRCYLELIPGAPDARQAHDQILLWQAKMRLQANARAQ